MNTTRRSLLIGAGASILAAPAIVRAGNLMPVRAWCDDYTTYYFPVWDGEGRVHAVPISLMNRHPKFEISTFDNSGFCLDKQLIGAG